MWKIRQHHFFSNMSVVFSAIAFSHFCGFFKSKTATASWKVQKDYIYFKFKNLIFNIYNGCKLWQYCYVLGYRYLLYHTSVCKLLETVFNIWALEDWFDLTLWELQPKCLFILVWAAAPVLSRQINPLTLKTCTLSTLISQSAT